MLPPLRERAARDGGEILAFTDADALRALETIMRRRPAIVALERAFAATPRGAALINRIRADPWLSRSDLRVISHEAEPLRTATPSAEASTVAIAGPPTTLDGPLDARGTRRAPRMPMATGTDVVVDGNAAALIDLSTVGAQVLSATTLKPNQRVRVTLSDDQGALRMNGTIAWATFEIPHRYRAGIDFIDPDAAAIDAYARRHQG